MHGERARLRLPLPPIAQCSHTWDQWRVHQKFRLEHIEQLLALCETANSRKGLKSQNKSRHQLVRKLLEAPAANQQRQPRPQRDECESDKQACASAPEVRSNDSSDAKTSRARRSATTLLRGSNAPHRMRRAEAGGECFGGSFLERWEKGEPVVVSGMQERLKLCWTPMKLIEHFGEQLVEIVFVHSGKSEGFKSLRSFLEGFGKPPADGQLRKLKDWPPNKDFAELLPDHFADLMQALPYPAYTHRDGSLNLVSALPLYALPPDLGPKCYFAMGSLDGDAPRLGTTNLHMDMSDAVNVLVYVEDALRVRSHCGSRAGPEPAVTANASAATPEDAAETAACAEEREWLLQEGRHAGALWHIWAAEEKKGLERFLWRLARERGIEQQLAHPIHSQQFYLNAHLRKRLLSEEGVRGYQFVQKEGEAVFIPAGSPHQVYNLRSSLKVALDFVSPQNISRCLELSHEFRTMPRGHHQNRDRLGTKEVLLHAASHALSVIGKAPSHTPHLQAPQATAIGGSKHSHGAKDITVSCRRALPTNLVPAKRKAAS